MTAKFLLLSLMLGLKFASGPFTLSPTNGDMSQSAVTAVPKVNGAGDARQKRFIAIVMTWTGSPVGNAQLYCSADNVNFFPVGTSMAVSGAGPVAWDVIDSGCLWFSVVYTKTSGSGTLTVTESSKAP